MYSPSIFFKKILSTRRKQKKNQPRWIFSIFVHDLSLCHRVTALTQKCSFSAAYPSLPATERRICQIPNGTAPSQAISILPNSLIKGLVTDAIPTDVSELYPLPTRISNFFLNSAGERPLRAIQKVTPSYVGSTILPTNYQTYAT